MRIITVVSSMVILLASAVSCKDDDPTLPPVTAIGAGTFGCRINGQVYEPQGAYSTPFVDPSSQMIVVSGGSMHVFFALVVRDTTAVIVENRDYHFNQENITCGYHLLDNEDCDYSDTPVSGSIRFSKIDFQNNIFAGTFGFTAYSARCDKTVNIAEGRFDLRAGM